MFEECKEREGGGDGREARLVGCRTEGVKDQASKEVGKCVARPEML